MKQNNLKRGAVLICILGLLSLLFSGCGGKQQGSITISSSWMDKKSGVMTGSTFDSHTDTFIQNPQKEYYDTYADMVMAVKQGKISAFLMDEPMARVLCAENEGITYLRDYLTEDSYAFAFPRDEEGALLRDQMNEYLTKIKENGTLDEIEKIWFGTDESRKTIENWRELPAQNGTLEFAAEVDNAPLCIHKRQ